MPASMTGFGSGQAEFEARRLAVEIRSVNHRYLDVRWHVFGELAFDRGGLERRLSERLHRGRVDVRVVLETSGGATEQVEIDERVVEDLFSSGNALGARLGLDPITRVDQLLQIPGVVRRRAVDLEEVHQVHLTNAFDDALEEIVEMRQSEGRAIAGQLRGHADAVARQIDEIQLRCLPGVEGRLEKMKARLRSLLDGHSVEEARLLQEAAILADRLDVTEELERLSSHLEQLRGLLDRDEPVGRRLDFLLQEMNREVNTIGSKSMEVEIAHLVIELKAELEKMREQSQNIE